ncbi:MAG: hypothetical protein ACLSVD_14255 [Eggerthellaceae bacterium]
MGVYSGNVTIGGTAGSGTNVQVLNGTHAILLNGVTINEPRANHAAIEIGSDTQAAQLRSGCMARTSFPVRAGILRFSHLVRLI